MNRLDKFFDKVADELQFNRKAVALLMIVLGLFSASSGVFLTSARLHLIIRLYRTSKVWGNMTPLMH